MMECGERWWGEGEGEKEREEEGEVEWCACFQRTYLTIAEKDTFKNPSFSSAFALLVGG